MLISNLFLPLKKEISADIILKSHQLMIKSGMIKQISAGIYAWLPLGLCVLRKIENIIREELNAEGFHEILMPTMQPADLWNESGRGGYCGQETLRLKDRHGVDMIYGPTAEEVVTFIARGELKSYKNLPCTLYNIQWKFRDEIRPRFGVMRGREFLMMDSYSFDKTKDESVKTYNKHYDAYLRIFARMGLVAIPMQADPGEIGGDLSHEFLVLADSGESEVFYDPKLNDLVSQISEGRETQNLREKIGQYYAATSDKHQGNTDGLAKMRGIEVGHIFYFGDKYTKPMNVQVQDESGALFYPECGSYGIGVGRLVAAAIEASNDSNGIIWHESISPFDIGLINIGTKNPECTKYADEIYALLKSQGRDVLYDNTDDRAGEKFAKMDLIGLPKRVVISEKLMQDNKAEIKDRRSGVVEVISIADIESYFRR